MFLFIFIYKFHLLLDLLYVRYIYNFLNLCYVLFLCREIFLNFFTNIAYTHIWISTHEIYFVPL